MLCLSVCDVGVLWPNGLTDQDKTWHAGTPRPWPHPAYRLMFYTQCDSFNCLCYIQSMLYEWRQCKMDDTSVHVMKTVLYFDIGKK